MANPMSKRIVLKSFRSLSFDLIVRQTPVRGMHNPQPMPTHGLALFRKPFAMSLLLQTTREVLNPLPEADQSDALEQHAHIPSQ